ncbi:MAG: histidine--tRNA ligase [bacterium]|nr:histidine--tRNA ligase [bacterium]
MKKTPSTPKGKDIQSVRGMHDILPADYPLWDKTYKAFKDVMEFYNFSQMSTPILESLDLYTRTLGETSDVVEKEMYTIKTKGGDQLAMRPEGTAGIVRSYIENGMSHQSHPVRLAYFGPFFRHDKPQAGRLRQFNQVGFEIFSSENDPLYDTQTMLAAYRFIEGLKIKGVTAQINTIGCRICRPNYRKTLVSYYKSHEKKLCGDCRRRLPINPLRLLDCKTPICQTFKEQAPTTLDYLCVFCKTHFKELLEYLEDVKLPYSLNHFLVRGLDYYTKTVFEFTLDPVSGEENLAFALGGGGRYDYLVEMLGGKSTPAVGAALGIERILEVIKKRNLISFGRSKERIFLVHIGDLAKKKSLSLIETLREGGIHVVESLGKESMDAQLRNANKAEVPFALIFGQKEAYEESVIIRDMKTGAQETVPILKLVASIKKRFAL